ncbi:SNF2 family N-terminal domain-containing protein [Jackrogersella minutella]|nr:SNF2 family N-terminal domain-containing protein [Jackrogersella minutella]
MSSSQGSQGPHGKFVQFSDPFPADFLGILHGLPAGNPTHDAREPGEPGEPSEPQRKRIRVAQAESIPVAREQFEIEKPTQLKYDLPSTDQLSRTNVHQYVDLRFNREHNILLVSSTSQHGHNPFTYLLSLGHIDMPLKIATIFEAMDYCRGRGDDSYEGQGALWVRVTIELVRLSRIDIVRFILELNWNPSTTCHPGNPQPALSNLILNIFFRSRAQIQGADEKLSPQAFYDAAFVPEKDDSTPSLSLIPPGLTSKLFPFQSTALQWLLNREGVAWDGQFKDGRPSLVPCFASSISTIPFSFTEEKDANGKVYYMSPLYHVVTDDITPFRDGGQAAIKGGILAEEMGLGKTVEVISLICTHCRENSPTSSNALPENALPNSATLIVTPSTLMNQWLVEFKKHAPHLRAMAYEGLKGVTGVQGDQIARKLAEHDVVITTYNVLQSEIHYAAEPPARSMRHEKKYRYPKSPLLQISWWRVCLDEAQQVESSATNAAKIARLIPRANAWGVTGTPVKEDIDDLRGLLMFLHYEPFASTAATWETLVTSHKELFKPLFRDICLRHTKRAVRSELPLPPQTRYVVTMPFTEIEEQHYQTMFKRLALEMGLDQYGGPAVDDWDPDQPQTIALMIRALSQLRQSILHPSLSGQRPDYKSRGLRTIMEALEGMIQQSIASIRADERTCLIAKLDHGQILEYQNNIDGAMLLWEQVLEKVKRLNQDCQDKINEELKRLNKTEETDSESDAELDEPNAPMVLYECRRRLASLQDIEHRATFFIASGYFQMKADARRTVPGSREFKDLEEKETSMYKAAKDLRQQILQQVRAKVVSSRAKIRDKVTAKSFINIPRIELPSQHDQETQLPIRKFQKLAESLNSQAGLVDEWRKTIMKMILQPLVDEDDEDATGEEYEDSTKLQDELMVYTLVFRAVIADRQTAISGHQNERVKYEIGFAEDQAEDGKGHAPKKTLELLEQRLQAKPNSEFTSFRDISANLRELATNFRSAADSGEIREIVHAYIRLIQEQTAAQSKAVAVLDSELNSFTTATNARVEYYKQLQALSDTVAPFDQEKFPSLTRRLWEISKSYHDAQKRIDSAMPIHRYLIQLRQAERDDPMCIICHFAFARGVLTPCGHQFCKECILIWLQNHKSCPMCKYEMDICACHDFTVKKPEVRVFQEHVSLPTKSKESGIYSEFSKGKLEAIQSINLNGLSFSTKVDAIAKHLIWLRVEDRGSQSVIFSQFPDFLDILSQAFDQYKIRYTSFKANHGVRKFKEDPTIECFLMDARAHASGLNLVNASHVFLCEPLCNTALELQAIARVDRIGQLKPTTVWLYLIDGTVEESIYNISVQRRLEHLGKKGKENATAPSSPEVSDFDLEAANSLELEQALLPKLMSKHRDIGEVVDRGDLWQCLFGHVKKPSPAEEDETTDPATRELQAPEAAEREHDE